MFTLLRGDCSRRDVFLSRIRSVNKAGGVLQSCDPHQGDELKRSYLLMSCQRKDFCFINKHVVQPPLGTQIHAKIMGRASTDGSTPVLIDKPPG